MGLGASRIVVAVGFILALAVHPTHHSAVDVNAVGWILVVFGLVGFFADLVLWSSWGPGYMRRPTRRRRVIEEEQMPPRGPGY